MCTSPLRSPSSSAPAVTTSSLNPLRAERRWTAPIPGNLGYRRDPEDEALIDRRTLLAQASAHDLAALFERVEALGEVVRRPAGKQVPIHSWIGGLRGIMAPANLDDLAGVLADRAIIVASLREVSLAQFQLVQLAFWHGGSLTFDQVVAEVGQDMAAALDVDAEDLARLYLAHRQTGWLCLLSGVGEVIESGGLSLANGLEDFNSDQIAAVLRTLGHRRPPTRKAERIRALIDHLRDPGALQATVDELPPEARAILHKLVARHPLPTQALDPSYRPRYWGGRAPTAATPLHQLEDRGLVHIGGYGGLVDIWLDVLVTLRGRMFDTWLRPEAIEPVPLDPAPPGVPPIVGTLDRLLALWSVTPADGLVAGGVGVRAVRSAAKTLAVPATTVATVAALAAEMGLLGVTMLAPAVKRGRTWTTEKEGWTPTALRADWDRLHPSLKWAHLVQAWRGASLLDETAGGLADRFDLPEQRPHHAIARDRVLTVLGGLADDTGAEPASLARHLELRHPFDLDAEAIEGVVAVLRLLGLAPPDGAVGLTPLARHLLAAPDALPDAIGPGSRSFIVQGDHTIVAPPDLEPGLLARLDTYAVCESSAGANLYRLDETRIARAMDAGDTGDAILGFFAEHATAQVPQSIEYLVADVARRHGRLRVGPATSYLTSDDPALVTRAVGVRAAKLQALAPTVAVSSLTRTKLVEVLRAKGLMPVAEDRDGSEARVETTTAAPVVASDGLPALRPLTVEETGLLTHARRLTRGRDR